MSSMSESDGRLALSITISSHVEGTMGTKVHAASIQNVLTVLSVGPKTLAAINKIVLDLKDEYI